MDKHVRCVIRRSNHAGEMYDSTQRPIGFGYQGKSFQLNEGKEVCLPKDAIYCFTDAIIETDNRVKDPVTRKVTIEKIKIPRFNIDYLGFYVCDKECGNDLTKCNGRQISRDEFFSDDPDVNERIFAGEMFKDSGKVLGQKKQAKISDEIEDIMS